MDHFETIIKTLLEAEGYWVRASFRVNLTKEEKRRIGKPSIPRPEIDLLSLSPRKNEIVAFEAKSFLDSPGVKLCDLEKNYDVPEGRYKLFTCVRYNEIVFKRLRTDLISLGMATNKTRIRLGLAAGNVHQNRISEIRDLIESRGWVFWSPEDVKRKLSALAERSYENEFAMIAAKILTRAVGAPIKPPATIP